MLNFMFGDTYKTPKTAILQKLNLGTKGNVSSNFKILIPGPVSKLDVFIHQF